MIFLFDLILTKKFKIGLYETGKFIAGDLSKESQAHLAGYDAATTFNFRSDSAVEEQLYITAADHSSISLFYDNRDAVLKLSGLEKNLAHLFRFVPIDLYKKTYLLLSNYSCIGWNAEKTLFKKITCNPEDKNQIFQVFNVEAHEELQYGRGEYVLLNKKEILLEKVIESHEMENEGENLINSIYNALDKFDICLDREGICGYTLDYLDEYYKVKGYKAHSSSSSGSSLSMTSEAQIGKPVSF